MIEEMSGKIDEDVCKYICIRVLEGLQLLHSKKILHRDIRSDNILVDSIGAIKFSELECATHFTQASRSKSNYFLF